MVAGGGGPAVDMVVVCVKVGARAGLFDSGVGEAGE